MAKKVPGGAGGPPGVPAGNPGGVAPPTQFAAPTGVPGASAGTMQPTGLPPPGAALPRAMAARGRY